MSGAKFRVAIVAVSLSAALLPVPPRVVDRLYSTSLYPWLQHPVTRASNLVPFSLFDVLLAAVVAAWVGNLTRDVRFLPLKRAVARALVRTVFWGACAYLGFVVLWGFNYRRTSIDRTLPFDAASVTREHARRVAVAAVDRLNALAVDAHRIGWTPAGEIDASLRAGLSRALGDIGLGTPTVARPKRTLLDLYFRRAGVEGMTDPFFLETLVVSDLLPFERPFVIAHEWAHLAGLAEESAASFAGWLACVHSSPPDQYSGWLFLYDELAAALPRDDRSLLSAALTDRPRADLAASHARVRVNLQPRVSAAAWRAYDSYLKSNRVAAGMRSYDEVVQLVLGTRFADDWTVRR